MPVDFERQASTPDVPQTPDPLAQPEVPTFKQGRISVLAHRARGFAFNALSRKPTTSAWAIAQSQIEDHRISRFGTALSETVDWHDTLTEFAGQKGALEDAFNASLNISDQQVSKASDNLLQGLRALNPAEQGIIAPFLQGAPITNRYTAVQVLQKLFGPNTALEGEVVTVEASDRVSADNIAALHILFPNFQVRFDASTTVTEFGSSVVEIGADTVYAKSSLVRNMVDTLDAIQKDKERNIFEKIRHYTLPVAGNLVGIGGQLALSGWGDIGRATPGLRGAVSEIDTDLAALNESLFGTWEDAQGRTQTGLILEILDGGMTPPDALTGEGGTPGYWDVMQQRSGAAALLIPLALHGLGRLGTDIHISRNAISPDIARAEMEALLSHQRTGVLGTAAELYRAPIRAGARRIHDLVLHLARDPEDFFAKGITGRGGRELLDTLDQAWAASENPDVQAGIVMAAYDGQIAPGLVRKMVDAGDRVSAQRAFIDAVTTSPEKYLGEVAKARATIKANRAAVQNLLEEGNKPSTLPEVDAIVDARPTHAEVILEGDTIGTFERFAGDERLLGNMGDAARATGETGPVRHFEFSGDRVHAIVDETTGDIKGYTAIDSAGEASSYIKPEFRGQDGIGAQLWDAMVQGEGWTTVDDIKNFASHQMYSPSGAKFLKRNAARTAREWGVIGDTRMDIPTMQKIARLKIESWLAEREVATDFSANPLLVRPSQSAVRNVLRGVPRTGFQRSMRTLLLKAHATEGRFFDLAKFSDEIATRPKLLTPGTKDVRADFVEHNNEILGTYMRRAGVDVTVINTRLAQMTLIKDRASFFNFVENTIFGEDGDIAAALRAQHVDPELIRRIERLHDNPIDERTSSILYGKQDTIAGPAQTRTFVVGRQLEDGSTTPMPSTPREFLSNDITLPSVDLLIDANSALRRNISRLGKSGELGRLAKGALWDFPRFVADTFTKIMKPAIMVARFPAMIMRIQLEQGLRSSAFGYKPFYMPEGLSILPGGIPIPGFKHNLLASAFGEDGWRLLDPDPTYPGLSRGYENSEVGMFLDGMNESHPAQVLEDMGEVNARTVAPSARHYGGAADELDKAAGDWLDQRLAFMDLDAERVLYSLEHGTGEGHRFLTEDMDPVLRESTLFDGDLNAARLQWLKNRAEYLRQRTGGDAELLSYISSGRHTPGTVQPDIIQRLRYAAADTDLRNIRAELKALGPDADPVLRLALNDRRVQAISERARLLEEYPGLATEPRGGISTRDVLKQKYEAGTYNFPQKVLTPRRFAGHNEQGSLLDDMHRYIDGTSGVIYRGLKPVSWADRKGTRGSLYSQAYRRHVEELKALGYPAKEAEAIGYVRATNETRNLMYDLNARTSFQRSLKDLMWFLPATQEVLYTWGVKIPSRAYWPIGAAKLTGDVVALVEGLKAIGVVSTNKQGENVIMMPESIRKLIDLAFPGQVPDLAFGKLTGLNLVTQNSGLPGLSTGANFLLGKAALRWGGVFKSLSDLFQPYGPEATLLPQPITFLHEAVFGEAPPWEIMSPDYLKAQWDRSLDQGLQFAYSDLYHQGIKPPRVEDFGTYSKAEDRYILSAAQEKAYQAARDDYMSELMDKGRSYAQGTAWVRFIGSTVAPMSLYTSSRELDNWNAFWKEVAGSDYQGGGLSDAQKARIDGYFADHPSSLAYNVYTTQQGTRTRDLPFASSPDDAFFDKYYTGEAQTIPPKEYAENIMALESRRFYAAQQGAALDSISKDRDPWTLLTHGYEKADAMQNFKESWDRYLALQDPSVRGRLDSQYRMWADSADVPTATFESERLSTTLDYLKQLAPMLTGEEGMRPDFVREMQGRLAGLYADQSQFGAPRTDSEKAIGWWFNNVFDPYINKTTDLYAQADALTASGQNPGVIYDQIRALSNAKPPSYLGKMVPSVEEMFFGNKSPQEQKASVNSWASRPITWLSDFQRQQVGYDISKSDSQFLDDLAGLDKEYYTYLTAKGIAPGSKEAEQLQRARDAAAQSMAASAGPSAQHLLALNEAQPFVRLSAAGFGSDSVSWGSATEAAQEVVAYIEKQGYSVKGYSQDVALPAKVWFYNTINGMRQTDPAFDDLMDTLRQSFPLPQGYPRDGALFYEAVFFGNFRTTDIPYTLTSIGE